MYGVCCRNADPESSLADDKSHAVPLNTMILKEKCLSFGNDAGAENAPAPAHGQIISGGGRDVTFRGLGAFSKKVGFHLLFEEEAGFWVDG